MPNATTLDSCPAEFILSAAAPESPGKDARLLEQLKHQNRRALERVMRRYTAYVGTILRNITRGQASSEDIEELTADVFPALWHHAHRKCARNTLPATLQHRPFQGLQLTGCGNASWTPSPLTMWSLPQIRIFPHRQNRRNWRRSSGKSWDCSRNRIGRF
ncbi:MAG: hypothetical protein ACLUOF_10410 [Ruminococcus sp.]